MINLEEYTDYTFTGFIYLPNKPKVKITGNFRHEGSCDLEGKMNYKGDPRDLIQGFLINNQTYCMPDSENNPKNYLMFAHFGIKFPNHNFHLVKEGDDFEGEYSGNVNLDGGNVVGITPLYIGKIQFPEMLLEKKEYPHVDLEVSRK